MVSSHSPYSISGGTFNLNCADDAIHSNNDITINSGTFTLATADDGIHGDGTGSINGADITVTTSYEGIEGLVIVINGGDIHITASDDGINIAGGNDEPITQDGYYLQINDGTIVVSAQGDGLDANGDITMTGGVVLVNGPTGSSNGALDYDGTFNLNGGFLVAAGSSGMPQAPSNSSSQHSVLVNFDSQKSADTLFHIKTQSGTQILTFAPSKIYQSVVFSTPDLTNGSTYEIYTGGSSTGSVTDGLYSDGTYTQGTQEESFSITNMVETVTIRSMPH